VLIAAVVSALAAYPLARARFPGRLPFIALNVVLMVVPPVVLIVPLFLFFINLGMVNSRLAVVIIYVGLLIPFSIYLLVNFFATVPRSLEEAAAIDGAGQLRTLWSVITPLSAPAIMTVVVVNAVWVWNELLVALVFLQDDNVRTLTAGLTFFQGRFLTNEPLVMTGALIATVPMLALYIVGQRFFIRGLTAGFGK
jgi:raffinose/stachyose/melibiose transport system permease protein